LIIVIMIIATASCLAREQKKILAQKGHMVTAAVLVRLADVRAEARRDASVLVGIEEALVRSRTEEGRLSRSMRKAKGDNHNHPAGGAGGVGGADAAGTGCGNSGGASGVCVVREAR
jgi:hypothetical protein